MGWGSIFFFRHNHQCVISIANPKTVKNPSQWSNAKNSTPVPKTQYWETKLRAGKLGEYQLVHSLVMCDVQKLNFSVTVLTFGLKAKNFNFFKLQFGGNWARGVRLISVRDRHQERGWLMSSIQIIMVRFQSDTKEHNIQCADPCT